MAARITLAQQCLKWFEERKAEWQGVGSRPILSTNESLDLFHSKQAEFHRSLQVARARGPFAALYVLAGQPVVEDVPVTAADFASADAPADAGKAVAADGKRAASSSDKAKPKQDPEATLRLQAGLTFARPCDDAAMELLLRLLALFLPEVLRYARLLSGGGSAEDHRGRLELRPCETGCTLRAPSLLAHSPLVPPSPPFLVQSTWLTRCARCPSWADSGRCTVPISLSSLRFGSDRCVFGLQRSASGGATPRS